MLEFHNQINIARLSDIESLNNGTVIFKNNYSWIKMDARSEVKPSDDIKKSKAGSYFNQKLKVHIEKLSDADKLLLPPNIPCIVNLHHDDGETLWGSLSVPCRINLSPGIQSDSLEITRKALDPFL